MKSGITGKLMMVVGAVFVSLVSGGAVANGIRGEKLAAAYERDCLGSAFEKYDISVSKRVARGGTGSACQVRASHEKC